VIAVETTKAALRTNEKAVAPTSPEIILLAIKGINAIARA
jgi:hypothetical protein